MKVTVGSDGSPRACIIRGNWKRIDKVVDKWHLEEGWWSLNPINRLYYMVVFTSGESLVLYHDAASQAWFTQYI